MQVQPEWVDKLQWPPHIRDSRTSRVNREIFTSGSDLVFPHPAMALVTGPVLAPLKKGTCTSRLSVFFGNQAHRVEVYSGYEYLDIDDSQINALLAGVRVWF